MTNLNDAVIDLFLKGHCLIPFHLHGQQTTIIDGFLKFLKEPEDYKKRWCLDLSGHGDPDDGYLVRRGGTHDYKSIFHYRPALPRLLTDQGLDIRRYDGWFLACDILFHGCLQAVLNLACLLDRLLPNDFLLKRLLEPAPYQLHCLRLLYYDHSLERSNKTILAKPHQDLACLTLHVAESHGGLRLGSDKTLYCPAAGQALIFPGKKAGQQTKMTLQALEHDVIDLNPEATRWAIVFFAHTD